MAITRSDMQRQLYKEGGILTLEDAKKMAPPGESLAYINKDEADLLKSLGGAGEDINGTGIKSYFIKKVFRKAKKAVSKVVKSPIGKAALLGAATFGVPGTSFSGLLGKGSVGSFFGKGSFNPLVAMAERGPAFTKQASGLAKLLGKFGLAEGTKLTGLGKIASIGGLSGLAGLLTAREAEGEDEIDIEDIARGEGLDISDIIRRARLQDPEFRFLPGGEFTQTYAGGGKVKTPGRRRLVEIYKDSEIERELGPAKDFTTEELREILFKMHGDQIYKPYADGGEVDLMGNPAVVGPQMKGQEMREYMIMNPDVEDVADYLSYYKKLKKEEDSKKANKRDKAKTRTKKAEGGIMDLDGFEMDLRGGGFVPMGAKEKADDVPARLSKNEFVMTADAVRAAGGGSIDKGADKMYKTMKQLESMV